jgi:hypothetical protein
VKKQSIVVYFEVNETCCIESRQHHEKLREDELRSWRSRQQERYELFQQPPEYNAIWQRPTEPTMGKARKTTMTTDNTCRRIHIYMILLANGIEEVTNRSSGCIACSDGLEQIGLITTGGTEGNSKEKACSTELAKYTAPKAMTQTNVDLMTKNVTEATFQALVPALEDGRLGDIIYDIPSTGRMSENVDVLPTIQRYISLARPRCCLVVIWKRRLLIRRVTGLKLVVANV